MESRSRGGWIHQEMGQFWREISRPTVMYRKHLVCGRPILNLIWYVTAAMLTFALSTVAICFHFFHTLLNQCRIKVGAIDAAALDALEISQRPRTRKKSSLFWLWFLWLVLINKTVATRCHMCPNHFRLRLSHKTTESLQRSLRSPS